MKKVLKNKKGFTLVELMVVVAILGVLVAVAVPAYNGVTGSAEERVCEANVRTIKSAHMQAVADPNTSVPTGEVTVTTGSYLENFIDDIGNLECPSDGGNGYKINGGVVSSACKHLTPPAQNP